MGHQDQDYIQIAQQEKRQTAKLYQRKVSDMWCMQEHRTCAKASTTEEPNAGKPHIRICAGDR